MPPSHKPAPAPPPADDTEPIELDADLLVPDTDPAAPTADELPAGLGWHVSRQWARVRPHARSLWYATSAALATLRRRLAPAAAATSSLALRLWHHQRWRSLRDAASRRLPGWPTSWRRLMGLATAAFALGALLPFALADRDGTPSRPPMVALERPPAAPAPAARPPAPAAFAPAPAPAKPRSDRSSRGLVGRQMAREAFEQNRWQDGVWYFRAARRAQRRAPGDDVLILSTIAALADQQVAPAAKRLLRELGDDARPLLVENARSHPDPVVRGHAQQLIRPAQPRPFLRWLP
jgi:hypothetical protein